MDAKLLLLCAPLALSAACTPDFEPASRVEKLRVLAVRAEPPEIGLPGGDEAALPHRAALTALVLRPPSAEPAGTTTVLYLACVPEPGDPTPSPCVALAALRDPTSVLAEAGRAACDGGAAPEGARPPIAFVGVEACEGAACGPAAVGGVALPTPELAVPDGYGFEALPPGAPERILGVQAVVLAFALDATPEELAGDPATECPVGAFAAGLAELWPTREHVLVTKRVLVRGPEAVDPPNRNPAVDGIAANGAPLAPARREALAAGTIALTPVLARDAVFEPYTKLDAAGAPIESAREEWVYSWFGTAGDLDELHTRGDEVEPWSVGPVGPAVIAVVARDLRGGVAWATREVAIGP